MLNHRDLRSPNQETGLLPANTVRFRIHFFKPLFLQWSAIPR